MREATATTDQDKLTTLPRIAREKDVAVGQLRRAAKAGELAIYQIGGWPRVRPRDVDAWLESKRVPRAVEPAEPAT